MLISPLNWGMGHVSRCIPIIKDLLAQGNTVVVACDQSQEAIFSCYFETIFERVEGYPFQFQGKGKFSLDLLKRIFSLAKRLKKEKLEVEYLVDKHCIDIVLSDHRYGFRSKQVPSIFITHQLNLPLFWYEKGFEFFHRRWLKKFESFWILDTEEHEFAGDLSQPKFTGNYHFLGVKSRFENQTSTIKDIDEVCIVSGPKPYSKQFLKEQLCSARLENRRPFFILPNELKWMMKTENFDWIASDNWKEMDQIILRSKKIISRSGYSTIMDLFYLKVASDLYSTPGQQEQVYLKSLHSKD